MLHKKKPLNIKIRQKYITYVSLLLNTALIGIFKRQSLAKWLLEFLGIPRNLFPGIPRNLFPGIPRNKGVNFHGKFGLGIPRNS